MSGKHSYWKGRNTVRKNEPDNIFIYVTPDLRMVNFWEDDELEFMIAERFGVQSETYLQIHSLMERGYLEILRRLKRAEAPFAERKGMLEQIETAIRKDKKNRDGMLKYLWSFCDAIRYYSADERKADNQREWISFWVTLLACLCGLALFEFAIIAVLNPTKYFPVQHMYVTDAASQEKLIDVSYQLNQLTGIAFFDVQGNLKTEIGADNEWGQNNLWVHEQVSEDTSERRVLFTRGSAVPQVVVESVGGEDIRSIHYASDGLMSVVYDRKGEADIPQSSRNIYYSDDGTITMIEVTNFEEYRYYNALLEPIYYYKRIRSEESAEDNDQFFYRDREDQIIGTEEVKTLHKGEGVIRNYKYTLGDGTVQTYFASFYAQGVSDIIPRGYDIHYPSEEIFTAHPESEKEYEDGRLTRETWGPTPEWLKCYYEYVYDQGRLVSILEYVIPYKSGEPVCYQKYVINEQGHISEILPQDHPFALYDLSIEYDGDFRIRKVRQYKTESNERTLDLTYTCEYRDDGSLECIMVDDTSGKRLRNLLVSPDGEIEDYSVPDAAE